MITQNRERRVERARRVVWSTLASLGLNGLLLVLYPHLAYRANDRPPRTTVVSVFHLEHRRAVVPRPTAPPHRRRPPRPPRPPQPRAIVPTPAPIAAAPRRRAKPLPPRHQAMHPRRHQIARAPHTTSSPGDGSGAPSMSFKHNDDVTLKMPPQYDTQDLANGAAVDISKYVDFSKAKGAFVPQVWLVNLNVSYLSGPTLRDAVHDVVASLAPDRAKLSASKPMHVCHGRYAAWFLSYARPDQDLPGQYENVLFVRGDTMYRLMYSRPLGQPEDPKTRAAMEALCPK